MNLHEFIHAPAITCSPDTSLAQVAQEMDRYNVGSVVVVGADGGIAGIVTDRDVTVRGVARGRASDSPVGEIMSPHVIALRDDADLLEAAEKMADSGCRRLPVTGPDGVLVGVVTLDDLMIVFAREADHLAHAVGAETTSPLPLP